MRMEDTPPPRRSGLDIGILIVPSRVRAPPMALTPVDRSYVSSISRRSSSVTADGPNSVEVLTQFALACGATRQAMDFCP